MFAFPGECEWSCPVPMSTGGAQEGDEHEFWGLASLQSNGKTLTGLLFTPSDDRKAKFLSNSSYYLFWLFPTLNAWFGLFKQSVFNETSGTGLQSGKHVVCVDQISICATTNECCVANKQAAIWSKMAALRMNEGYCQWELSIHSKVWIAWLLQESNIYHIQNHVCGK